MLILYGAGLVLAGAAFVSVFLTARDAALVVVALLLAGFIGVHRLGYDEFAFLRRGTILKVYTMPAVKRGMFVVYVDTILAVAAAYLVVGLKTDHWSFSIVRHSVLDLATTFAPVTVLVFWWSGMYRGSWRVSGLDDLTRACRAVAIVTVVGASLVTAAVGRRVLAVDVRHLRPHQPDAHGLAPRFLRRSGKHAGSGRVIRGYPC